jgi:hypothetical protein
LLRGWKEGHRHDTTAEGRLHREGGKEEGVGGQGAAGEEGVQDPVEGDAFVARKGREGGREEGRQGRREGGRGVNDSKQQATTPSPHQKNTHLKSS